MNKEANRKRREKNRRDRKRNLLIAFLLLLVVGVVLGTGTYAWFTANKTVTVSDITVHVAASNGLQISADGITFKTILSNDDLNNAKATYADATNQIPSDANSMVPVSTVGELSNGKMKMFKGEILGGNDGGNILAASRTSEINSSTTGDFIAFDVFLQVTSDSDIYLTSNSKAVADGTSTGIENAARMGFVYEGNSPAGSSTSTIQSMSSTVTTAPTTATDGNQTVQIWELNNDVHTASAITNASSVYGLTTTATGATQLPYDGVKADISAADAVPVATKATADTTHFGAVSSPLLFLSTPASGIPQTAYPKIYSLKAGITKVRVYIWVEGQDVDCENNASGGALTYSLQFSMLKNSTDTGA